MEQQELQNKIGEYYSRLPKDIQEKFSSMVWLENLKKISAKYNLNDDQIEILGTETTLALLGVIHLTEYAEILAKELKLEATNFQNLVADINDDIFRGLAPKLTEVFMNNNELEKSSTQSKEGENVMTPGLEKKLEELPNYVKEAVNKSNYGEVLFEIAKSQGLSITEIGELEKVTTDLIDGKVSPDNFQQIIDEKLKLEKTKSASLVSEINEKILKNIRKNMMSETKPSSVVQKVSNPPESSDAIFKKAGIEILTNTPELPSGAISDSKLAEPFKIPSTKTEYSIANLSKSGDKSMNKVDQPVKVTPPKQSAPISYGKQDPYRMPLE